MKNAGAWNNSKRNWRQRIRTWPGNCSPALPPAGQHPLWFCGILAALAGFAALIAGISTKLTVIGVAGFALMVAGAHCFLYGVHPQQGRQRQP
ncbi:DUF3040 domain-containing protein [Arthrobacter sp. QXT-31]|uniref:DUF3040 domain-containing protein n=1 Tax=Arthrobacter sp. QXT-31 TaxID=1357915 RepID=UPI00097187DF|nr:hypothetical protein BWQ92_22990 [Arthrobacter sp. QXT-31]